MSTNIAKTSTDMAAYRALDTKVHRRFVIFSAPSASMSPEIEAGDMVEIDTAVAQAHVDGVYLVDVWGTPELKRVQRLPNGNLSVWADTARDIPETVSRARLSVLGRVIRIWNGKRL